MKQSWVALWFYIMFVLDVEGWMNLSQGRQLQQGCQVKGIEVECPALFSVQVIMGKRLETGQGLRF